MEIKIQGGLEPYVQIEPVLVKFNDTQMAEALFVHSVYDDCYSFCTLKYKLGTLTPVLDDEGELLNHTTTILFHGQETISGDDYANWDGNNNFPFEYIVSKIPVVVVTEP